MKQILLTLIGAIAIVSSALADLTPNDFAQLKSYAEMHGSNYAGLFSDKDDNGKPIPYWQFGKAIVVPQHLVSTLDEAIVAYNVSQLTYVLIAKQYEELIQRLAASDNKQAKKETDALIARIKELEQQVADLKAAH
jgi:predicted S18 family serine protease